MTDGECQLNEVWGDERMVTDLEPGAHLVELACESWGVLAKARIRISEPCEQLMKHDALFKRITY